MERENVLFMQESVQGLGRGRGLVFPVLVALTAVSSSALNRSSQATADFWKASCRLMRL